MAVLSNAKAEPTDPVRGLFNDIVDIVGFPHPEASLGTPADLVHMVGAPTVKEWLPMPVDIVGRFTKPIREAMGRMPGPPDLRRLLPVPGEGLGDATRGGQEARATTGAPAPGSPTGSMYRQRYY